MDLSTDYLGLKLSHPLTPGASPLTSDLDTVRKLEDSGAAAIVLHSLFEEQILNRQDRDVQDVEAAENTYAEALSYYPRRQEYRVLGPDRYLEDIRQAKQAVSVPVIASLNGVSPEGWVDYAARCQEAGADALELNVYFLATDVGETGAAAEQRVIDVAKAVVGTVSIPVGVKLSPFFSSLPNLVHRLEQAGAKGVVLFNRFYQPDIDPETLEVTRQHHLSDSSELLLRLRWLAILSGKVRVSLAAAGGVHTTADAVKAIMAGAHSVQIVSALLKNGPGHLRTLLDGLIAWLEEHEYASMAQLRGSMSLEHTPSPAAFERGNYVRILQGGPKYV